MQKYWESIRRSIQMQPLPPSYFPIRVGDTVDSPQGRFLVASKHEIPGDNIYGRPPQTFYEGQLLDIQPIPLSTRSCSEGSSDNAMDVDEIEVQVVQEENVVVPSEAMQPSKQPNMATFTEDHLVKKKIVRIMCYDCEHKGETNFHPLGLECQACRGFNTTQL